MTLPGRLKGMSAEQLEELTDLAELKAWTLATQVSDFGAKELEVIAQARELGERAERTARERLYRPHLWTALRWFLFGGYVDLVGLQEKPLKAYDPDTNPWLKFWVPGWARTKDEHDVASPYKPLPDKDYLRLYAYAWVNEPLLAVPKSRQMMVTWVFACIAAWVVMWQPAQLIGFQSKKEGDADKIIDRVMNVLNGLPRDRFYVPEVKRKATELWVPEADSKILALSENPDAVRSHTFSWLFSDEIAFQEYAAEAIRATLPSIHGGARFTLVSTSNGEETFHGVVTEGGRIPVPAGR